MTNQGRSTATALTANAFTRAGYSFTGWNTAANGLGTAYANGALYPFTADATLYAQWTPTYTVTYNGNGNTGGIAPTDPSSPYNSGATVTVLGAGTLTRTGYTFTGWNTAANGSGTSYAPAATFTINSNTTLYAQWSINSYTVTFNANGGTGSMSPQTGNYNTTAALTLNTFTRTGYTFDGWNTAADGSGTDYADGADYTFTASVTLYAQWTVNNYTVSFDAQGGTPTPGNQTVAYGGLVTDPGAPTRTGYTFSGWYTAPTGGSIWTFATDTMGAADMTLYARWTVNNYTVSFDAQGGTPTPGNQTVAYGGLVTDPGAPTRTGYTFSGWYTAPTGGSLWTFATDTMGATDMTLYARWTVNNYTVSFDAQGGTPTPGNQTVAYGGLVTDPGAPTRTGYTFSGWYTAPTGGSIWTFATDTMGAADMTLYARWTVNNYTVSFDAQGGTPTPGNQTVAYGGLVTDPGAPTRTGYTFSGWYTAPTGGSLWNFATDTMGAADMTLYARWTVNNYTVSFDAQGGTPTPGNQTVAYGGLVTDPGAPTRTGYTFSGWYTAPTGGSIWTLPPTRWARPT